MQFFYTDPRIFTHKVSNLQMQAFCWFIFYKDVMRKLKDVFMALFVEVNVFDFILHSSSQRRVGQTHNRFRCCTLQQCSLGLIQYLYA